MEDKRRNSIIVFAMFLILSISITILPNDTITVYGMFGEVRSSMAVQEKQVCVEQVAPVSLEECSVKGVTIINIWFILLASIICLIYSSYSSRMGRKDTIVTLKVRMDD